MTKIIIGNNTHREEYVFANTRTVRSVLEEAEVNYHVGTICLNSNMLDRSELDRTLAEFGIDDDCDMAFLTVIENKNNAVRVIDAMGNYIIQVDFSLDDIECCEENACEALTVKDGKRVIYAVARGDEPEISRFGMCFARENDHKCCMDVHAEDDLDFTTRYGKHVAMLKRVEAQIATAMEDIDESTLDIVSMIEHLG